MRPTRRLGALCAFVSLLFAVPASAGIHYRATTTVEGQKGSTEVEAWIDGSKAKIAIEESSQGGFPEGSWMLTTDAGETLYLVNPKDKTYTRLDLAAAMSLLKELQESGGGMFKLEIRSPQVTKLDESAGPSLLGMPTRHYRFRTTYDLEMKVMGMGRTNSVDMTQDLWVTDGISAAAANVWLTNGFKSGFDGLDELMDQQMNLVQGFPLRSVVESTMTGEKGKRSETTRSETVVNEVDDNASIPASAFEIPADYTEVEPAPMMADAANDNPDRNDEADEGGEDDGKKKGRFGRLKDVMGGGGGR
jgi:hypothetical protein